MKAFKCDRCGALSEGDTTNGSSLISLYKTKSGSPLYHFPDLCEGCMVSLRRWWQDGAPPHEVISG